MIPIPIEENPWSTRRWLAVMGLFFLSQVFLIWWLGESRPPQARTPEAQPGIVQPVEIPSAILELADPTLFYRPTWHGFSGAAWLAIGAHEYQSPEWTDPPRFLALEENQLGGTLRELVVASQPKPFQLSEKIEPSITPVPMLGPETALPAESYFELQGTLAFRAPDRWPPLPSRPSADLLRDTLLRVGLDADGWVCSAIVIQPGSGDADADRLALETIRTVRFAPAKRSAAASVGSGIVFGTAAVHWMTVPPVPAITNTPPP